MIRAAKTIGAALFRLLAAPFRRIAKSAHYNRCNAYFRKGDYDRAIASYSKAIRIDPGAAPR